MKSLRKGAVLPALALLVAVVAQATDSKEIHQTIPLDRDGRVSIETYKGSITVTTWDRPEVRVDARIEPDGLASERGEKEKVALTDVRFTGSGGSVAIKSDYHRLKSRRLFGIFGFGDGSLPFVHYSIEMPATARLEIKDYKSEIRVADLKADLKLKKYKGIVAITHLDGAASIDSYKGDIRVEFARFTRASRLETYKGEVEVRVPKDSRFDLDADAGRRGDIHTEFTPATLIGRSESRRAAGSVNGGGPALRFVTYKGSIRLRSS
jgi:hypothetical protein